MNHKQNTRTGPPRKPAKASHGYRCGGRKECALADLRTLEANQRKGELLDAGEVRAAVAGMIRAARSILLAMPGMLADKLTAESDPIRCRQLMEAEVHRALGRLSEGKVLG